MASTNDVILIGALIFMFSIGFFVLYFVSQQATNQMLSIPTINESAATKEVLLASNNVRAKMDYVIFGLFIGLVLGLLISGWFVGGHPLFMAIYFLVIVIGVATGAVLSNVWETTTSASIFGSTLSAFPLSNNLMSNMPMYIAIVGFLGMVVMFAKPFIMNAADGGGTY